MHDHDHLGNKKHSHTSEEARTAESSKPGEDYAIEAGRDSATHSKGGHKIGKDSEVMHPIADGDTNDDDVSQREGFKE